MTRPDFGREHRGIMRPSERLDALRGLDREAEEAERMRPGTMLDQLERAEAAVREGPGHALFSEGETYADFHFGTDIPTGLREVQSGDGMADDEERGQAVAVGYAVMVCLLLMGGGAIYALGLVRGWW